MSENAGSAPGKENDKQATPRPRMGYCTVPKRTKTTIGGYKVANATVSRLNDAFGGKDKQAKATGGSDKQAHATGTDATARSTGTK